MYQVTVKGRNLEELKSAVADINDEFNGELTTTTGVEISTEQIKKVAEELTSPNPILQEVPIVEAPTMTSQAPVNGQELDSEGLPWDARIHTVKRTKVKAGTWKIKKGSDANVVAQVKAELRANMQPSAPIPAAPVNATTPVVAPVLETPAPVVEPVTETFKPIVPVKPTTAVPPMGTGHTLETFKLNFAMVMGNLITEGKLDQNYINSLLTHFGIAQIWMATPEQQEEIFNNFVQHNIIQQVG